MELIDVDDLTSYTSFTYIGFGGQGRVYSAIHRPTRSQVAIKQIRKTSDIDPSKVYKEMQIHQDLNHPCLCRLFDFIDCPNSYNFVMELGVHGTLYQHLTTHGAYSEQQTKSIFIQLLAAIEYLHEFAQVCHRDLKPENVLIDQNNSIQLIDFGLSNVCPQITHCMKTFCGSLSYASPEMLQNHPYSLETDIWSLGVILYACAAGVLPFLSSNQAKLVHLICTADIQIPQSFSGPLRTLVLGMLDKDPKKRLSIAQIKSSEWLKDAPFHVFEQYASFTPLPPIWKPSEDKATQLIYDRKSFMQAYRKDNPLFVRRLTPFISLSPSSYRASSQTKNMNRPRMVRGRYVHIAKTHYSLTPAF